jgi:hypothetical protein
VALARLLIDKADTLRRDYDLTTTVTGIATRSHGTTIHPDGLELDAALRLVAAGDGLDTLHRGDPVADALAFIAACPADLVMETTWLNPRTGQPATDCGGEPRGAVDVNKGQWRSRTGMTAERDQDRGFFSGTRITRLLSAARAAGGNGSAAGMTAPPITC